MRTPTRQKKFIDDEITAIPEISGKYAVFKPIEDLMDGETPLSVIFTVNPVELAVLMHLAGSLPGGNGLSTSSRISACQALGSNVLQESKKDVPNGVLGMTDLAGRGHCRNVIPNEYLIAVMRCFLKWKRRRRRVFSRRLSGRNLEIEAKTGLPPAYRKHEIDRHPSYFFHPIPLYLFVGIFICRNLVSLTTSPRNIMIQPFHY